jgi:PAS domain S-box-containing protein
MNMTYDSAISASVQEKKHSIFQFSKTFPALIVLIAGIAISIFIWRFLGNQIQNDNRVAFDKATTSVVNRLESGVKENEQILSSINGLYANSVQVVRDMFELYGSIPTRSNNALLSVCYVPFVTQQSKEDFIYYAKSERYYDYAIKPEGNRDIYYPIEYIVPLEKNMHRSGFDIATNVTAMSAITEAKKNNGAIVASAFYDVRPDTAGFLMMFAVHKEITDQLAAQLQGSLIDGIVMLELNAKVFFERCIGTSTPGDSNIVYSITQENSNKHVFASNNFTLSGTYSPLLIDQRKVKIADKELTINFATVPNFGGTFQAYTPLMALIGGIITSFVAAAFLLSVLTSRARAEDLAERMTRSQRRIVDASQDIIAVIGLDGKWKSLSPAVQAILGYSQEELLASDFGNLLTTDTYIQQYNGIVTSAKDEVGTSFEGQMKNKKGDILWMSWNLTVSRTDGLIYAIGRDITLQKMAEDQIKMKNRQVQLAEQSALEVSEFKSQFMRELSHGLRNNLTGTLGFLQLVTDKVYDTEDEMQSYIANAENSSEQLYVMVTDIDDVTESVGSDVAAQKQHFQADKLLLSLKENARTIKDKKLSVVQGEDSAPATIYGKQQLVTNAINELIIALTGSMNEGTITINTRPNTYEKVVEVELMVTPNDTVAEMIDLYKKNINNLVDIIPKDQNEIIFHLGLARSMVRRCDGTLLVESLGKGEPNICQITFPMGKITKK